VSTEYPELEAFDQDFAPTPGRRPGLESIADGDHDFEITAAELTRTEKSLRVDGSSVVEHAYFFRNQTAVDILGSDLCTLGFDADQWKPPARPFSRELPDAIARLVGVRFRGKKKTSSNPKDPSKPYTNLYVNQRLDASAPPTTYQPDAVQSPAASDDPIPF
jgi:hypothetical protein